MNRGENAAEKFVRDLQQEAKQLFDEHIATPKPTLLTLVHSPSCISRICTSEEAHTQFVG